MRNIPSVLAGIACASAAASISGSASAHIELLTPPARYELPANKSCPCGDGDSNRVCQDTAEVSTDPFRSENVTTFEAGSTITIRASEYIDHAGRMRVAFDPDGADLADFNDNILMDVPDPADPTIVQAPRLWDLTVTLPTTPCDNCTLQVVQVMGVATDVAVADPAPASTYYTCADIRIVPAGTLVNQPDSGASPSGTGGAAGSANVGAAAAGGAAGAAGSASAEDGGAAGTGSGDSAAAGRPSVDDAGDDASDDSGCAIQPGHEQGTSTWLALGIAGAAIAMLRRQRR